MISEEEKFESYRPKLPTDEDAWTYELFCGLKRSAMENLIKSFSIQTSSQYRSLYDFASQIRDTDLRKLLDESERKNAENERKILEIEKKYTENNRRKILFREWNKCTVVEEFVRSVAACNFSTSFNTSIEYKKPRGSIRVRGSSLASSVHASQPDEIQCSRFRIKMLPHLYFKRKWNMEPALLNDTILVLFRGDEACCESFISDQAQKLEAFRLFFFCYRYGDEGDQSKIGIPEVTLFQPLFQLFLDGFLKCLETGSGTARRTASVNSQTLRKENIGSKSFAGYLDAMIFPDSTSGDDDDACLSHSLIELKSPFSSLLQTQPEQHIDQLIAETACVSAMKAVAKAGGSSSKSSAAPTVGALTDLFALHFIYQPHWESKDFYISNLGVLEPRIYIQHLLVLCLESSAVRRLADASVAANESVLLAEDQESEHNDSACELGDVDEAQQQQPQGGGLKRGSTGDGWEGNASSINAGKAYRKHPTISFNYEEYDDDMADDLEFLRQYEMRRTGVTLTRANLALLGGIR